MANFVDVEIEPTNSKSKATLSPCSNPEFPVFIEITNEFQKKARRKNGDDMVKVCSSYLSTGMGIYLLWQFQLLAALLLVLEKEYELLTQ